MKVYRFEISIYGTNGSKVCVYKTDEFPVQGHGTVAISYEGDGSIKCIDVYSTSAFGLIEIKERNP